MLHHILAPLKAHDFVLIYKLIRSASSLLCLCTVIFFTLISFHLKFSIKSSKRECTRDGGLKIQTDKEVGAMQMTKEKDEESKKVNKQKIRTSTFCAIMQYHICLNQGHF